MDDRQTEPDRTAAAEKAPGRRGLARYARPALIAGVVVAVVCAALLVIVFLLDTFNATVYSVDGKNVADATDEARAIRDTYAGVRTGSIIFLVAGAVAALTGGFLLYRTRNDVPRLEEDDDGLDWDYDDLAGE